MTTVVFEDLYRDGIKIATHSDIEDEGQTVEIAPQNILVQKLDQNGSVVLGAQLEIRNSEGTIESWTVGQKVNGFESTFGPGVSSSQSVMVGKDRWTIEPAGITAKVTALEYGKVSDAAIYNLTVTHEDGSHERYAVDSEGRELYHRVKAFLPDGEYTLHEESAPEESDGIGYLPAKDISFNVAGTDETILVKMVDMKTDTVEITKYDATNMKELSGAQLKVTDKDGNVVDEWTSKKEQHKISGLIVGETYKLTEVIAPQGYTIAQAIEFTVEDNGKVVQQVKMVDDLLPRKKVITSAGNNSTWFAFMLVLSAVIGISVLILRKRETE